jgi:hypothetical protein
MKAETKAAKPAKFSVQGWAITTKLDRQSRCECCRSSGEARAAIEQVCALRIEGKTEVSQAQVASMLREHFGLSVSRYQLRDHIRECLHIGWLNRQRLA